MKILVMRGDWTRRKVDRLDPHFHPGSDLVARFKPDQEGAELAAALFGFRKWEPANGK
jgi:hypothetical protein